MEPSLPAIASAVAAVASAVTAFVMMRIQHQNSLEAARPEIVLSDWSRISISDADGSTRETISFSTIRNVGKGPALRVHLTANEMPDDHPTYLMPSSQLSILAPGESEEVSSELRVFWDNVSGGNGSPQVLFMDIVIYCWDRRNRRHETHYKVMARPPATKVTVDVGPDTLASGLRLVKRTTTSTPVWWLRLKLLPRRLLLRARRRLRKIRK